MLMDKLSPPPGAKKPRKRVGRGDGSGRGTYSGRGSKGQKSRAGYKMRPGFEGGQLPLIKRLPEKRGFHKRFRKEYDIVKVGQLAIFEPESEVNPEKLVAAGLIKSLERPVKILADGEISQPLVVRANRFSAAAKAKIEAAGGKAEEVGHEAQTD